MDPRPHSYHPTLSPWTSAHLPHLSPFNSPHPPGDILETFIRKYVQCYSCGNPETRIKIKKEDISLKCKAGGRKLQGRWQAAAGATKAHGLE